MKLKFTFQLAHYDVHKVSLIYRVLKNYIYNISGMIEEVKTNTFLFDKTLAYAAFYR